MEDSSSKEESPLHLQLPFPPLTKQHVLNCSYHSWYPKYRSSTPKSRLIPLSAPFLEYLRADGIRLPHETASDPSHSWEKDSGVYSETEDDDDDDDDSDDNQDPAQDWRDLHDQIGATIRELAGSVVPKLNWSAPKDAVWISHTNSLECRSPDDVYLLLKSSDFVTHDLEHAFDECEGPNVEIPYHLVLRKYFKLNPSLEFRCFVRRRKLIGITQRDLNHFDFLAELRDELRDCILEFFEVKLQHLFVEENFVFDVYIPPPHEKVWLIDINPWTARTDPILFSWLHLLTVDGFDTENEDDELPPEFLLVGRNDPEAYNFSTTQYSAHKLPKDVVDASRGGESVLREFAKQWQELVENAEKDEDT